VFFRRPLSATVLVIAVALVIVPVIRQLTARRGMRIGPRDASIPSQRC
jgi:TctA family transporter